MSGALQTPVKVERLAYYLEGYNVEAYEELLSGFLHGFRLHYHGPQIGQVSTNLPSAAQHPEIVDSKLAKEVHMNVVPRSTINTNGGTDN